MDIQRLRNLTTGRLHTTMGHVYEDLEYLTGEKGLMTHMLPRVMRAVEPFLRLQTDNDPKLWQDVYDPEHIGDVAIRPLTAHEVDVAFTAYSRAPSIVDCILNSYSP